jgi:ABC-type transport system substrate-binding protein
MKAHDKRLIIGPSGPYDVALFYYLALNQYAGPLKNKLVREAVATAVDKQSVVQITGGPAISTVSNQMVLPGNVGYVNGYNATPANKGTGNAAASKALLKKAGYPNGLSLKLIASTNDPVPRIAQSIQSSLNAGGFKITIVPVTMSDFYGKYMYVPSTAKRRVWDIAIPGWIPDWFGNNGRTVLQPLFTKPAPGSSDFGGYNNPTTNTLIQKALTAKTPAAAAKLWTQVNIGIDKNVASVSLNASKVAIYHSSRVQGCNFWWDDLTCDVTNIWLKQ